MTNWKIEIRLKERDAKKDEYAPQCTKEEISELAGRASEMINKVYVGDLEVIDFQAVKEEGVE